jgi:hypothetical protein
MEYPTDRQIADAIVHSKRAGETQEELEARIESMVRMSDEDLAALGIVQTEQAPAPDAIPFEPAPVRRRVNGWTADRQRTFIAALAETGCVSEACAEVGITPRSAYRLREHPGATAFRDAWDHAQHLASARLTAIAWERAIHGANERLYKDGELIAERRKPSDRLLMWLLAHHNPTTYGWAARPPGHAPDITFFPVQNARKQLPSLLEGLADVARSECPAEGLTGRDCYGEDELVPRA